MSDKIMNCAKCGDTFTSKRPAYGYRGDPYRGWYCKTCYHSLPEPKVKEAV